MNASLPTGLVTFLFTDIEGSTRLWERRPEAMRAALAIHDRLLRQAIESNGGHVVKMTGDGVMAAFGSPAGAVAAALAAQRALLTTTGHRPPTADTLPPDPLNTDLLIRARMGIHTGAAELREGDYHGPTLNRAARLMATGHGGQVLLSGVTAALRIVPIVARHSRSASWTRGRACGACRTTPATSTASGWATARPKLARRGRNSDAQHAKRTWPATWLHLRFSP